MSISIKPVKFDISVTEGAIYKPLSFALQDKAGAPISDYTADFFIGTLSATKKHYTDGDGLTRNGAETKIQIISSAVSDYRLAYEVTLPNGWKFPCLAGRFLTSSKYEYGTTDFKSTYTLRLPILIDAQAEGGFVFADDSDIIILTDEDGPGKTILSDNE